VAITTGDGLVAGIIGTSTVIGKDSASNEAAGISHTPWYASGIIGAGAAPTGGLNGVTFSGTVNGQVPIPAAAAGKQSYVERLSLVHTGGIGHIWLIDRLWGNVPVVTTTTGQAVTSPTWPARDASASTIGAGVYLAIEVSATTGNAGAITNTTIIYTNSGNFGWPRTATLASFPITGLTGTWLPFSLQAGDAGVRSVETVTLGTSYVSGAIHIVAYRLVASIPVPTANIGNDRGWANLGLPKVWDNSVLQLVYFPTGTAVGALVGEITYAQG